MNIASFRAAAAFALLAGSLAGKTWPADAGGLHLWSTGLAEGDSLPISAVYAGFGCKGGNTPPPLRWSGVPAQAKSLALTVYDPDAPTGSGWWHWVVTDIPATLDHLPASGVAIKEHRNDFSAHGYGGPCPPAGDKPHRYVFTLYALDAATLDAPSDASPAMIGFLLHAHALAKTETTFVYGR